MRKPFARRRIGKALIALLAVLGSMAVAIESAVPAPRQRTALTYLLPAPREVIVFAPFVLAQQDGLYAKVGLDVRFTTVAGGAKVGEALGRGEGDLGGAVGDTPILLRANGVRVQGVALLGHHAFLTLMMRKGTTLDAESLRGKTFGVPSYQDTSYYALAALVRAKGLALAEVTIRAAPMANLIAGLGSGEFTGIVGTVDSGVKAERIGVAVDYYPADDFYPALAQVVMASDVTREKRPEMIRQFVSATLAAVALMRRDPEAAARHYATAVPKSGYTHGEIVRVFKLLAAEVYGPSPGRFEPMRMDQAASAAVGLALVPAGTSARGSYTNKFTGRR